MFETAGPLAIVKQASSLIGLVALPLAWTVLAAIASGASPRSARGDRASRVIAVLGATGTFVLAVVLAARLVLLPSGSVVVQHLGQLGRLGQLDLAFDLALDPVSAVFAVVIALVAYASVLDTAWCSRPLRASRLAWTGLVASGVMLACVGDGFAPILVGIGASSVAAWGLSRARQPAADVTSLAGGVSVLTGLFVLFWSLGGAVGPEGYEPDGAPPYVLVATPTPSAAPASAPSDAPDKATLAMTTHAGALVSSDEAALPGEPLVSPFSIEAPPGVYTLRVHHGVASGDVVVPRVGLAAGRSHVLAPYGPTASLRVLRDQLAVPRVTASRETMPVRDLLAARRIAGLDAGAAVLLLVLGGALASVHAASTRRGATALASTLEAALAPYLAIRLAPLVEPLGVGGALVTTLGTGSAVALAARAASLEDPHEAMRGVLAVTCCVALAATGLGEPAAALVLACTALVATSAALAALAARREGRWVGIASTALVGLVPAAGASSGFALAVGAALGTAAASSTRWAIFAEVVASGMLVALALGALCAFRVYDTTIVAAARDGGVSRRRAAIAIVLSGVALGGGIALGTGTAPFGGKIAPVARVLVGASVTPTVPRALAVAGAVLAFAAAAAGALVARRSSAVAARPSWLVALGRGYAPLSWSARGVVRAARYLARAVRSTDRDVVDAASIAAADGLRRAARSLGASRVGRQREPSREDRGEGLSRRNRWTDPERFADRVLLALIALLGTIVLSSLLLR